LHSAQVLPLTTHLEVAGFLAGDVFCSEPVAPSCSFKSSTHSRAPPIA
jgi:hypothetical protein